MNPVNRVISPAISDNDCEKTGTATRFSDIHEDCVHYILNNILPSEISKDKLFYTENVPL